MTTAIAPRPAKRAIKDFLLGDEFKRQVSLALPRHLTPDRFIRTALTAMNRNPKLAQCIPESFFQCLLDLSALGLEADGRRAHLIPFEDRKRGVVVCTLIVDYKGLAELTPRRSRSSSARAARLSICPIPPRRGSSASSGRATMTGTTSFRPSLGRRAGPG